MRGLCMATKTISLELDAYEKLKRAKSTPRESVSMVIRRARWEETGYDGKEVLGYLKDLHATRLDSFLILSPGRWRSSL